MIFGVTRSEIGLTLVIFALIYAAGFVPRIGARLGVLFGGRR